MRREFRGGWFTFNRTERSLTLFEMTFNDVIPSIARNLS